MNVEWIVQSGYAFCMKLKVFIIFSKYGTRTYSHSRKQQSDKLSSTASEHVSGDKWQFQAGQVRIFAGRVNFQSEIYSNII